LNKDFVIPSNLQSQIAFQALPNINNFGTVVVLCYLHIQRVYTAYIQPASAMHPLNDIESKTIGKMNIIFLNSISFVKQNHHYNVYRD